MIFAITFINEFSFATPFKCFVAFRYGQTRYNPSLTLNTKSCFIFYFVFSQKRLGMINDGVLHSSHEVRGYPSHFSINFEAPQNESTPFLHVESHQNELSYSKYLDSRSDANSLEVTSSQIPSLTREYDISCEIGNDSVRRYEDKS